MCAWHTSPDALAERNVLRDLFPHEHEGGHVHAVESYPTSHRDHHGRPRSGDPGHATGRSKASAAGFSLDPGCHPDVQSDVHSCLRSAEQGSERLRAVKRVVQDVLVVAGLPADLRSNDCLVGVGAQLAPGTFLSSGAALWRMAPPD